ncbi:MAG: LacI family DNA-binding transcriptional regulator [Candidatus Sulfotelmatobacter sp.]
MATIAEVAKRARSSTGTVSNVIRGTARVSPALRARVEAAIRDLDFHPNEIARSLKVNQTYMLGLVLPDVTNPFFPQVIRGAEDRALERGFLLVTANTDEQIERERRIVSALRSRRVDGILLAPTRGKDVDHIRRTIDSGIPVVCLDRLPTGMKIDAVLLDNVRGAQECVRHLIRTGYRSIAIITGPLELGVARERLRGYEEGLREAGIAVAKDLILEGDFRERSGYELAKHLLLQFARPSAILVSNGMMALGVLQAFEELGVRCPEDVALATFDDIVGGQSFHPHLTVVAQPGYEIGALGAAMLMDRIEGRAPKQPTVARMAATLIVRESTRSQLSPKITAVSNRLALHSKRALPSA